MPDITKHAGPVLIAGALAASVVVASLTNEDTPAPEAKPVAADQARESHSHSHGVGAMTHDADGGVQDEKPTGRQRAMEAKARQQRWAQERRAQRSVEAQGEGQ